MQSICSHFDFFDEFGTRGNGQAIFTYSKSPGWLLTPTRGGAIQLAYLPGSWHGFISEEMNCMSSSLGSHSPLFALHSSSLRTSPAGLTRLPANSPIRRLNPLCGWTNLKPI